MISYDLTGLLAAMGDVVVHADARVAELKRKAAQLGTPVSCEGCRSAGCCYMPTATFIAEALYIAKHNPVPADLRPEYIRQGEVMENSDKEAFFQTGTPCVYLTAEKTCSIYAQRPGACRRYNVVSEPKLCMPGSYKKVTALNTMDLDSDWVELMVMCQIRNLGVPLEPIMIGALPKMVAIASTALEFEDSREVRRYLRAQSWLRFDQPMSQVDPEVVAAYQKR